jgi:CRP-like cAMP-binding protein
MPSPTAADLSAVELFSGLSEADLAEIAPWFEVQNVAADAVLAREGASGYAFMVLGTASAVVLHDEEVVRHLHPGDFFGEAAILGQGRRTATVRATSEGTVWVLFGTRFREMGLRFPEQHAAVERALSQRTD